MSHENSITVQNKQGKWVNLSTVYKGKPITEAKATALHNAGYLKPLGGKYFPDEKSASARAYKRSTQTMEDPTKRGIGIRTPGARR